MAAAGARWTIKALDTGSSLVDQSVLTYLAGSGTPIRIPRVMWVLEGPTTVVVDTSVPTGGQAQEFVGEEFSRTPDQEPANALHLAGISPGQVELVVMTHLHWDHAGNGGLFPEARLIVQERELQYAVAPGRFFGRAFLAPQAGWPMPPYLLPNLEVIRGEQQLAPGLVAVPVPGHTPGSQALVVDTAAGRFCIAGDAVMSYGNLEQDLPPGFHVDVDHAMDSMDLLRRRAEVILPSHDYRVFSGGPVALFPTAAQVAAAAPAPAAGTP